MTAEAQNAAVFQRIGVLGGGAWGTALAQSARRAGRDVTLWAHEPETAGEINAQHTNRVFLPGVSLDPGIKATTDIAGLAQADAILLVAPSKFMRAAAVDLARHLAPGKPVAICAKGFEEEGGLLMSEVLASVLPENPITVLSGPSFAGEVARDLPVAVTLACENHELGDALMRSLAHKTFRVYWTDDVRAVQIGGAVKNVLAIAAGIVEGRHFGASAHAALTARGFAEMARFGTALGGRFETLTGLSGLGDLILTAHSTQSRNMSLGHALGQGKTLEEILASRKAFTEGVHTAGAVVAVARKHGVEMPICEAVDNVVKGRTSVDEAVHALLSRPLRPESDFLHFAAATKP
jgi:glycerol-3-phosphate dehydrogenase (NAD(P)+)